MADQGDPLRMDRRRFLHLMGVGVGGAAVLGLAACEDNDFILGETKPSAANTGPKALPTSVSMGDNVTFSTDDEVIENVRFERRVSVAGKRITFRNCEFVGPNVALTTSLVNCTSASCEDIVFEFCLFRSQRTALHTGMGDAVSGHKYTLRQCDISHVIDGLGIFDPTDGAGPVEVNVEGCYIHDLVYFSPHSRTSDNATHNDCVQLHNAGGHNGVRIIGNTLVGFVDPEVGDYGPPTFDADGNVLNGYGQAPFIDRYAQGWTTATSCVMHSPQGTGTVIQNVRIERNWLDGGSVGVNYGSWSRASGSTLVGNRFGRGAREGRGFFGGTPSGLLVEGNVMEDTGQPHAGGPYPDPPPLP